MCAALHIIRYKVWPVPVNLCCVCAYCMSPLEVFGIKTSNTGVENEFEKKLKVLIYTSTIRELIWRRQHIYIHIRVYGYIYNDKLQNVSHRLIGYSPLGYIKLVSLPTCTCTYTYRRTHARDNRNKFTSNDQLLG